MKDENNLEKTKEVKVKKEKKKLKLKLPKFKKVKLKKKLKPVDETVTRTIDKKELKRKIKMEQLRTGILTNEKVNVSNIPKEVSKPLIIGLGIFGALVFVACYFLFGTLIAAGFLFIYLVVITLTQILDNTSKTSKIRKFIKTLCIIILIFAIICVIAFGAFFTYIVIKSPEFDVSKLERGESSILYDKDGAEYAKLGTEKREKITYDEMPEVLIDAIIATEDSRFFQHNGFDAPRFIKAAIGQVLGRDAGGASTLTMQVAKNNFSGTDVSITRKFTDIYLSIFKIERAFTKQEIIEFYVNAPYLGSSAYGVEQASQTYFGKSAKDMNLAEAALIAGLFQAPGEYDPNVYPEDAYDRRDTVLNLMVRHGYITEEEASIANAIPIEDLLKSSNYTETNEFQAYIDTVVEEVYNETGLDPYVYPMLIYTNMDRTKQKGINDIFNGKTFTWPKKGVVQAGVAVVESGTGKILAIGAGRNRTGARTFNYATDINRQIGSTAKPLFDYGPGMEYNNWSTAKIFDDKRVAYGGSVMSNFDGAYRGKITLRFSLSDSRNVPALLAFREVDNAKILQFVTSLGITPEIDSEGKLHEAHSVGAFNGSNPLAMAGAYAAFSNGGYHYDTHSVSKIVLRDSGEELEFKSTKIKVMSDSTAYMITDVLKSVASTTGVRGAAGVPVAVKTGTTNYDYQTRKTFGYPSSSAPDGWIAGYSTNIAMAMWTGYIKNEQGIFLTQNEMVNQRNGLYRALAKVVYGGTGDFKKPSSVVSATVEKGTELLPSEYTPSSAKTTELFKRGTVPTEISQAYVPLENVTDLALNYSENNVNLSWTAAPELSNLKQFDNPGDFGYLVYLNDVYLGFTKNTKYTYTADEPYGTYKVVTGYASIQTNRSNGATVTLSANVTFSYNDVSEVTIPINSNYTAKTNPIFVFKDGEDCTNKATITTNIFNTTTNSIVNSITTSKAATFEITYTASYLGKEKSYIKTVIVK